MNIMECHNKSSICVTLAICAYVLCVLLATSVAQLSGPVKTVTACTDEPMELSCKTPYDDDDDKIIELLAEKFGSSDRIGQDGQCTFDQHDCFYSIVLSDRDHFDEIYDKCDGKNKCSVTAGSGHSLLSIKPECKGRESDYVHIEYVCVWPNKKDDYTYRACTGAIFDLEMCPSETSIIIEEVAWWTGGTGETLYSCTSNLLDCTQVVDPVTKQDIGPGCNGKRACVRIKAKLKEYIPCKPNFLSFTSYRDSVLMWLKYGCREDLSLTEVSKCNGETFNDTMCPNGHVIRIINAFYGDHGFHKTCSEQSVTEPACRVNVDDTYMSEIREYCDGNRSCGGLFAQNSRHTTCTPQHNNWNKDTDFVTLVYRCVQDERGGEDEDESPMLPGESSSSSTSPTSELSKMTTMTSSVSGQTDSYVGQTAPDSESQQKIVVIVTVVAISFLVVVIAVVVGIIIKRCKSAKTRAVITSSNNNTHHTPVSNSYSARSDSVAYYADIQNDEDDMYDTADNVDDVRPNLHNNVSNVHVVSICVGPNSSRDTRKDLYVTEDETVLHDNSTYATTEDENQHAELDDELTVQDNAMYGASAGPSKSNPDDADDDELTVQDNAMYGASVGPSQSNLDDDDELTVQDNAMYGSSVGPSKSAADDADDDELTVQDNTMYGSSVGPSKSNPVSADDDELTVEDNAMYGSSVGPSKSTTAEQVETKGPRRVHFD